MYVIHWCVPVQCSQVVKHVIPECTRLLGMVSHLLHFWLCDPAWYAWVGMSKTNPAWMSQVVFKPDGLPHPWYSRQIICTNFPGWRQRCWLESTPLPLKHIFLRCLHPINTLFSLLKLLLFRLTQPINCLKTYTIDSAASCPCERPIRCPHNGIALQYYMDNGFKVCSQNWFGPHSFLAFIRFYRFYALALLSASEHHPREKKNVSVDVQGNCGSCAQLELPSSTRMGPPTCADADSAPLSWTSTSCWVSMASDTDIVPAQHAIVHTAWLCMHAAGMSQHVCSQDYTKSRWHTFILWLFFSRCV